MQLDIRIQDRGAGINIDHGPLAMITRTGQPSIMGEYMVETRSDQLAEYEMWLEDQMKEGNPHVLDAVEAIATKALTKEGVTLITKDAHIHNHGKIIQRIIEQFL